ncbi:hypothetical protein HGRIS_010298 [Hohenbuehelia grisea]|uniref:Uncharacterized protein n=1 Tax=Hohenbuehelia grisea TaxID=104357 RepID=A0ABR3J497_9AGAR
MSRSGFRSRMGTVMRRTSSVLTLSRPGTPSRASSEADASSLHKIDTTTSAASAPPSEPASAPAPAPSRDGSHVPSPIPESPAREAAASEDDIVTKPATGPSPLSKDVVNAESPATEVPPAGNSTYVPPPILTSTANPGAFVDEPEEMSQAEHPVRVPEPQPAIAESEVEKPAEEERIAEATSEPEPETEAAPAEQQAPPVQPATVPVLMHAAEPHIALIDDSQVPSGSYFAVPVATDPMPPPGPAAPTEAIPLDPSPDSARPVHNIQSPTFDDVGGFNDAHNPWGGPVPQVMPQPMPARHEGEGPGTYMPMFIPVAQVPSQGAQSIQGRVTAKSSRASLAGTSATAEEKHVKIMPVPIVVAGGSSEGSANGDATTHERSFVPRSRGGSVGTSGRRSRSGSVAAPNVYEDPFADPPNAIPVVMVSGSEAMDMPHPLVSQEHQKPPVENHGGAFGNMAMPRPHNIGPLQSVPSLVTTVRGPYEHDTDETRPLLSRPHTPQLGGLTPGYTLSPMPEAENGDLAAGSSQSEPRLHHFGWIEYVLPDASFYYVHPTLRVATDIDLRNVKKLDAVTKHLEIKNSSTGYGYGATNGWELWLREMDEGKKRKGKDEMAFLKCWIDHKRRILTYNSPLGGGSGRYEDEDRIDMEYRYWSFVEAHPAHVSLPQSARSEAINVLTWSYTDRLLPYSNAPPPPFSQEECHELTNLLRTFENSTGEQGLQGVVHTRIISRILLRVAESRQAFFRPNIPLPQDATKQALSKSRSGVPFRRAALDFLVSCVCLGMPYLFFNRTQHHRFDVEDGGLRSAGPMLMVGACTCLVAWIVSRGLWRLWRSFVRRQPWSPRSWPYSDTRQTWTARRHLQ